ncbi:hypothetical protein F4781DRAFT_410017 [Annulohypoxylon bovei var. microspora]|nr:hypothetical protein F4781DRAFT_410017 [Annulohypoxylon bovei var. microspora]
MKVIISLLVGAIVAGVAAMDPFHASNISNGLPDGYTAVPLSMKGSIEPGGEVMTFNGTVNDIMSQIQTIKHDFKWDDFHPTTSFPRRHVSKRTKSHIICKIPHSFAGSRVNLLYGYDYLKNIHQPCEVSGGPSKCAMLWCLTGTSIWMCNDNTDTITRDCGDMASYVLDIIGDVDCITQWSGGGALIQGQEFDTDGFNIIAGGGGCSIM